MKIKCELTKEDIETLRDTNHNYIEVYKNFNFNKINIIFCIILLINIIYLNKKIEILEKMNDNKLKSLDNHLKNFDYNILTINQQFEVLFSFLYNFKNESSIYHLLKPKGIMGKKKIRIGAQNDGGYVLMDDFANIKIAYSFGISNEISFDKGLADKNIDVFMYDHTIQKLPFTSEKFHWKKIGITEKSGENNNMKTLNEILKENGHINEKNMILKIDIEGGEWNIFKNLSNEILRRFKYILVEFHFGDKFVSIYTDVFKKLNETHQIFHLHCNNCCPLVNFDGYMICSALEISYIIREKNTFIKSSDYFPVKNIDYKNIKTLLDFNHLLNIYQIENILSIK